MIVTILHGGGLAGGEPTVVAQLDTSTMLPGDRERAEKLVDELRQRDAGDQPIGTDMEEYVVEVSRAGGMDSPLVVRNDYDPDNPGMRAITSLLELGGGV
jgi:hypothetical protein